ncbi:MAG TPA: AAA family ATPase, partial [Flavobacteriales bacterium]|nr:AAA family ATPase [Flavobacteriales bacterium]
MAIDFKTLLTVLPHVTSANHPILLRGRHGIGKSSVVYQYAATLKLPIVERRASQMTEGDLLGLPTIDEGVTSFCPPDWLAMACDTPVVLFLDEVDRATLEVRQGIFELCDSRKLAGHVLHPETLIFAAVNGGVHAGAASYQVGEMDPAELDRYTVFDVEPSIDDWIIWANDNCAPLVTDFIRNNTEHLEHNDDPEPSKVYPSRRSWARFSDTVAAANLLTAGESVPAVFSLASAYLGFEAAVAFNDFVANYSKVVTISDILDKGKTPDIDLNAHCALID